MPSIRDLVVKLTDAHIKSKSGRLYVYIKNSGSTSVTNISILKGELSKIDSNELGWRESVDLILKGTILKILFVPVSSDSVSSDDALPIKIVMLIKVLARNCESASRTKSDQINGSETAEYLVRGATEIVTELIGDSGTTQVGNITAKFSPQDNPRQFLDACRDLVAQVAGEKAADMAFARLYEHGLK